MSSKQFEDRICKYQSIKQGTFFNQKLNTLLSLRKAKLTEEFSNRRLASILYKVDTQENREKGLRTFMRKCFDEGCDDNKIFEYINGLYQHNNKNILLSSLIKLRLFLLKGNDEIRLDYAFKSNAIKQLCQLLTINKVFKCNYLHVEILKILCKVAEANKDEWNKYLSYYDIINLLSSKLNEYDEMNNIEVFQYLSLFVGYYCEGNIEISSIFFNKGMYTYLLEKLFKSEDYIYLEYLTYALLNIQKFKDKNCSLTSIEIRTLFNFCQTFIDFFTHNYSSGMKEPAFKIIENVLELMTTSIYMNKCYYNFIINKTIVKNLYYFLSPKSKFPTITKYNIMRYFGNCIFNDSYALFTEYIINIGIIQLYNQYIILYLNNKIKSKEEIIEILWSLKNIVINMLIIKKSSEIGQIFHESGIITNAFILFKQSDNNKIKGEAAWFLNNITPSPSNKDVLALLDNGIIEDIFSNILTEYKMRCYNKELIEATVEAMINLLISNDIEVFNKIIEHYYIADIEEKLKLLLIDDKKQLNFNKRLQEKVNYVFELARKEENRENDVNMTVM